MRLVSSVDRPSTAAIHQGGDLWLLGDEPTTAVGGEELIGRAARDAVPRRYDLPPDHPLYGLRALRAVTAGSGDIIVSEAGVLERVGETEAVEVGETEVIRVRR